MRVRLKCAGGLSKALQLEAHSSNYSTRAGHPFVCCAFSHYFFCFFVCFSFIKLLNEGRWSICLFCFFSFFLFFIYHTTQQGLVIYMLFFCCDVGLFVAIKRPGNVLLIKLLDKCMLSIYSHHLLNQSTIFIKLLNEDRWSIHSQHLNNQNLKSPVKKEMTFSYKLLLVVFGKNVFLSLPLTALPRFIPYVPVSIVAQYQKNIIF